MNNYWLNKKKEDQKTAMALRFAELLLQERKSLGFLVEVTRVIDEVSFEYKFLEDK